MIWVVRQLLQRVERCPTEVRRYRRAAARAIVEVRTAGQAQPGAVSAAQRGAGHIEQNDLAHDIAEVELIAHNLERLRVGDHALVELVNFTDLGTTGFHQATATHAVPRHAELAVDHDSVTEGLEVQPNSHLSVVGKTRWVDDLQLGQDCDQFHGLLISGSPQEFGGVDTQRIHQPLPILVEEALCRVIFLADIALVVLANGQP